MNVCTIIAKNYLAHARVLAESFREHHPDGKCFVLVIDDPEGYLDPAAEPFEVVMVDELPLARDDFLQMALMYDVLELSTAVKPWFLRHLLEERVKEPVAYLDPDIEIFGSIEQIEELARQHDFVVTPHTIDPLPDDGKRPNEKDLLIAGTYNLGFLALAPGQQADRLLSWWSERLRFDCLSDPREGFFVDQRWFDRALSFATDFYVLRDPGFNVAYWNLTSRHLEERDGDFFIGDVPLRFFHYSGFDASRPYLVSKYQNRLSLADDPVLARLFARYAERLLERGYEAAIEWPYSYARLPDGTELARPLRRAFRELAMEDPDIESPFTEQGAAQLIRRLQEPAGKGAHAGINRFLEILYDTGEHLQRAYPNLDGDDAVGYAGWCHVWGSHQVPIPEALLPPVPEHVKGLVGTDGGKATAHAGPPRDGDADVAWGVNVAGYLRSELGVGEAARAAIQALEAADVAVAPVQGRTIPLSRQGHEYLYMTPTSAPFPINLICVNADGLPAFVEEAGPDFFEDRYSVGIWWWEVSSFREEWIGSFDLLDELWVGTQFIADTLEPISPIPVRRMRLPVAVPAPPGLSRAELGLPEGFLFLYVYDFHGVFERKNPLALVEAFKRAFPPGSGVSLAIKSINADFYPEEFERLRVAAMHHPDIHVVDRYVSAAEKNAMMAGADCYVSLHRSEGFGFTLGEAMYFGKPVIATGYGGNLEFMTPENSYLVRTRMVPIGEDAWPYPPDGEWAEPDVEHAASLMRRVVENPDEARARGMRAADDIRRQHDPATTGAAMAERLEEIKANLERRAQHGGQVPGGAVSARRATEMASQMVARGPAGGGQPSRFGRASGLLRRLVLRLIKPYTAYQRTVDETLVQALGATRASHALLRQDVGALQANLLTEIRAQQNRPVAGGSGAQRDVQRLVQEMRARPAQFVPFETFEAPGAGLVYGYRNAHMTANGAESYRRFEDVFRGSEGMIRERQRRYLPLIRGNGPVLDVGCGRGEFLDLLAEAGIEHTGIDPDPGMVEHCRDKGHRDVVHTDANPYLERLPELSYGTIFSAQVIEHMDPEYLERFLSLAAAKLRPGGILIAETVNPHSVQAMKTFWVDLTHRHPIFPEVALTLCRISGFGSAYVFHPNGSGNSEADTYIEGEYAVVATAPERPLAPRPERAEERAALP